MRELLLRVIVFLIETQTNLICCQAVSGNKKAYNQHQRSHLHKEL